jgi:hypothetical protein
MKRRRRPMGSRIHKTKASSGDFCRCRHSKYCLSLQIEQDYVKSTPFFYPHTAKTQYQKFETNIPRGIVRAQSQFPHSCVCERFIYSLHRSAYSAAVKYLDRSWEYINRSQGHESVITIYVPMIYTALCIIFWMRAYPLRGQVGGVWA